MKKNILYLIKNSYTKFLGLFFDFDLHVYAHYVGKIKTYELKNFLYNKPIKNNCWKIPAVKTVVNSVPKIEVTTHISPSLISMLVIKNSEKEFFHNILIRDEKLNFTYAQRKYNLNLINDFKAQTENLKLLTQLHKKYQNEIQIEKKLKTIEELLVLEPYTNKEKIEKILEIPVVKSPIKKNKFSEIQLSKMRTKLAIQAKCKAYSMTLENIYDKIPQGLFSEISIEKDETVKCFFETKPDVEELQLLITGKRKYDTQITRALINYSELGL